MARIVAGAAEVAGTRDAAFGLYGPDGAIRRFVDHGMDDATVAAIGPLPQGRALLGRSHRVRRFLRSGDIAADPRNAGARRPAGLLGEEGPSRNP